MKEYTLIWKKKVREVLERYQYAGLVLVLGIALLLLPARGEKMEKEEPEAGQGAFQTADFEARLEEVLSRVEGAGETWVILMPESGSQQILAQDRHQDERGGTTTTVVVGKGSGAQDVVALQTLTPRFRGALVVCPGGGNPQVRLKLMEAMSALTGLGTDCISVCCGNE